MKTNQYELGLLVEAIELSLTKVKRKRGECDHLFILPIRKVPEEFREPKEIAKLEN